MILLIRLSSCEHIQTHPKYPIFINLVHKRKIDSIRCHSIMEYARCLIPNPRFYPDILYAASPQLGDSVVFRRILHIML